MAKLKLTIACDGYDYLAPLKEALLQSEWVILGHFRLSGSMQVRLFGQGFILSCKPSLLRWRTFTVVFKL